MLAEQAARQPRWKRVGEAPRRPRFTLEKERARAPCSGALAGVGRRLFAVEAEKSRKTLETSDVARKSYQRSFMQWREFIGSGQYRAHFGTDAGMVVLYVFSDQALMQSAMRLLQAMTEGRGNTFILFKACPEFSRNLRVPQPLLDLFSAPWQRAGRDPFAIDRAL